MTPNETLRVRVQKVYQLSQYLWEAQAGALADSEARAKGFDHHVYPSTRPMLMRPCFRESLLDLGLPQGWTLGGDTTKMVQIYLCDDESGIRLRYLKERRATYPGGVPAAGHNQARRCYWQPPLFDCPESNGCPSPTNLLLLWDYLDSTQREDGFSLRIVHPVAPGRWGEKTPIDLSLNIPNSDYMESGLEFKSYPEDTDFFADLSEETGVDGTAIRG